MVTDGLKALARYYFDCNGGGLYKLQIVLNINQKRIKR